MATINVIVGCFEGRSRVHGRRQQDAVEVVSDVLVTEVANAQVVTERATLHDASVHKNTNSLYWLSRTLWLSFGLDRTFLCLDFVRTDFQVVC